MHIYVYANIGDYEGLIAYQKGDYEEAQFIRQSLIGYTRRSKEHPLIPGFFAKTKSVLCLVTNWSGCYKQITLPDSTHVAHFPVLMKIRDPYFINICIIFMVAENKLAVFSLEHPARPVVSNMEEFKPAFNTAPNDI
jgi:hypothetical protein